MKSRSFELRQIFELGELQLDYAAPNALSLIHTRGRVLSTLCVSRSRAVM